MVFLFGISSLLFVTSDPSEAKCDRDYDDRHLSRNFVADVVEVVSPAVVNIVCPAGFGSASSGSGFFISKDGTIVTNAHVVAPSMDGTVVITMKNGKKRAGKIHSMDTQSDLAIVQMTDFGGDPIPTVQFGVSSKVRSGEFVIAIGSPMHLQDSASLGIVSATARHASELGISNNRSEYIQTDAAINMGNSGGPLVNLDGEVIGINTMKVKGTDGISFAIPIDIASQIIKQLLTNKRVIRPFVGLKMVNMVTPPESSNKYLRRRQNHVTPHLSDNQKVVVLDVVKDSPAFNAGIMRYE
jgi:HtrA serine peptidase 2